MLPLEPPFNLQGQLYTSWLVIRCFFIAQRFGVVLIGILIAANPQIGDPNP